MPKCDQGGCKNKGEVVSRLSPQGFLVSSGKGAYSFREAYQRFNYCIECHSNLMTEVWTRVRNSNDKDDDHIAPTAI